MERLFHVLRHFQWVTGRETGLFGCSHDSMDARMTSALTPAVNSCPHPVFDHPLPSDGRGTRGRIVRRSLENLYDWLGWTFIRKTKPANVYFLSQGRGQKVRASVNTHSTEIVVMFKKLDPMRPPAMLGAGHRPFLRKHGPISIWRTKIKNRTHCENHAISHVGIGWTGFCRTSRLRDHVKINCVINGYH